MPNAGNPHWPHVPGYEIRGILGRGGFATVFEAVQLSVDRPVALKVITQSLVEPDVERRFRGECETVGLLSWHPNVVALYDAGITPAGLPFLAMEMVLGGSWGDRVKRDGARSEEQVIAVGLETVDALGAAHDAGILHRDVKPDNVLIGRRGEALLGDFGVAILADATRSTTGEFRGTFAYAAPEVLRSERATPVSDVYGLGVTLYTLAVGRSPFVRDPRRDSPADLVMRIVSADPPPIPASISLPLAAVIEQAMAKDPARRFPSALSMQEALQTLASSAPDVSSIGASSHRPAPARVELQPWENPAVDAPHRVEAARAGAAPHGDHSDESKARTPGGGRWRVAVSVFSVAVVAAAVVAWWISRDESSDRRASGSTPEATSDTSGREGTTQLDLASVDLGGFVAYRDPTAMGSTAVGFGSVWTAAVESDSGLTVVRIDQKTLESTVIDVADARQVAVGSDAVWVAAGSTGLFRIDPETNEPTIVSRSSGSFDEVVVGFGSVWAFVASLATSELRRIDPSTNEVIAETPFTHGFYGLAKGPDSMWFAAGEETGEGFTLSRLDPETNAVVDVHTSQSELMPIGGLAAVGVQSYSDGSLSLVDDTETTLSRLAVGECDGGFPTVDFTADPLLLATTDDSRTPLTTLCAIDRETGEVSSALEFSGTLAGMARGPDAVWIAATTEGGRLIVSQIDAQTREVTGTATVRGAEVASGLVVNGDAAWVTVEGRRGSATMYRVG